jgi:hypothetical protein
LRTFFGLLSRGVPARSRGKAASGVMSTIVTPRTGPEQSRPNRRHCRQKSPVSSHLVPLSACHQMIEGIRRALADGAHLDAPSPTLVAASAAHSPGSHRSYEPPQLPQAGLPSGGTMSLSTDCRIERWREDGFKWAGWRLMRWRMRYFAGKC